MTTAIDTNVLLDIFLPDPAHAERSAALVERASEEGALVICHIVLAELAPLFPSAERLNGALERIGIDLSPLDRDVAFAAGQAWRAYRAKGGKRTRILSDFLIGARALLRADRLLTRDRGFYRTCFPNLTLLE